MAEVIPFRGVLYNVPKVSAEAGGDLLAPPYDIITPEYREELYRMSPYNIVRVDFGREEEGDGESANKYTRARGYIVKWMEEKALVKSDAPCFYAYEISYALGGAQKRLRGIIGLVRLEELGKGTIHPHECTHSKPKKDRLDLMRTCNANISPIFSIYRGKGQRTSSVLTGTSTTKPHIEGKDHDGSVHRLWEISDRGAVEQIRDDISGSAVFIADGHHRYETALEFQREMRAKEGDPDGPRPYDYVMMFLADIMDEGLSILPTHRLVKEVPPDLPALLSGRFDVEKKPGFTISEALAGKRHAIGLFMGENDGWYLLSYKGSGIPDLPPALGDLDVSVLHDLIFGEVLHKADVTYEMNVAACLSLVRAGEFGAAFFLNPTRVEDVESVALASLRMPPKSTYFYPKLMTGMVLNIFDKTFS